MGLTPPVFLSIWVYVTIGDVLVLSSSQVFILGNFSFSLSFSLSPFFLFFPQEMRVWCFFFFFFFKSFPTALSPSFLKTNQQENWSNAFARMNYANVLWLFPWLSALCDLFKAVVSEALSSLRKPSQKKPGSLSLNHPGCLWRLILRPLAFICRSAGVGTVRIMGSPASLWSRPCTACLRLCQLRHHCPAL